MVTTHLANNSLARSAHLAMETLGSAASVFAVVSVADQLAHRVKQLYDFWSAVSEAPDNVRVLAVGLNSLLGILTQISNDSQRHGEDKSTTDILQQCIAQVAILMRITESLEIGFESSSRRQRKWSAMKAVFREEKISTFRSELADLKSTLTLAQLRMLSRSSNDHFEEQKLATSTLQETFTELKVLESSRVTFVSDEEKYACISAFYLPDSASKLESVPVREPGSCEWIKKHRITVHGTILNPRSFFGYREFPAAAKRSSQHS